MALGSNAPLQAAEEFSAPITAAEAGSNVLAPPAEAGSNVPAPAAAGSSLPAAEAGANASTASQPQPKIVTPARQAVFELDKQILLVCADFARFRLRFHDQANRSGFWRSWIYPLEQETGTALSFANTLTDLTQRARGLQDPDKISRPSVKRGLACAVTGQTITATSSSIELLHNGYVAWSAAQQGFSPKKSAVIVGNYVQKIDELLKERAVLVTANPDIPEVQSLQLQGKLLKHIRNQLLYSFKDFSMRSREQAWSENTFYAIDATQALCQLSASFMTYKGFSSPACVGAAAITNVVANSMVTANPIIRTAVGRYMARRQRRHLDKLFPQEKPHTLAQLKADWEELAPLFPDDPKLAFGNADSTTLKEVAFLCMQSQTGEQSMARETAEINRLHRVADQQAISGPIIGLFSLARSTSATVAYYKYRDDRVTANRINFAGRISQATGQAYSLIATPRAKIKSVLYQRKLAKKGRLPSQIYEQNMKRWDAIEKGVKEAKLH